MLMFLTLLRSGWKPEQSTARAKTPLRKVICLELKSFAPKRDFSGSCGFQSSLLIQN